MKYSIKFRPEIEDDALSAYHWYEKKSNGLGEEFLRIFYANALELVRSPLICRKVYKNFRRRLLRRFPYVIYFVIEDRNIIIFGLFHAARDPGKIERILNNR
jgi:plasmid stabilization system protein ParE